ncbi:MAG: RNA 2',3'-cyclic phosphodiesterase [Nitrososphaera sp.]|uniref:RNA 2',3'-cyclic phosphodiesterase n=1 Tax=Nitrososphaera sp. TaxID=1971748 RepID=UPI003D6EAA79
MRLFVAADVSSKAGIIKLQQDIAESESWSPDEVRPVEKQNLHFTLMFIGESEGGTVDRIKSKLSELRFEPFRITYTGIGGHPDLDSADKIWVGVDGEGAARLSALSSRVAKKLGEIDLEPDKPFIPHVPVFHARAGRLEMGKALAKYRGKSFGSDLIDKIHLKKSEAGGSGYTYSRIFTKALGAP